MGRLLSLFVAVSLAGAVGAVACGGGSSKTVNVPGGQVSVGDKIPSDFPGDFPIYDGAKVQGSTNVTSEGITGTSVIWQTGDSAQKVTDFFTNEFKDGAWTSSTNGQIGSNSYWAGESKDGTKAFYLTVSSGDGDNTTITAIVGDKPSDSSSSSDNSDSSSSDSGSSDSTDNSGDGFTPEPATLPDETELSKDFPTDRVPFPSGARVTSSASFGGGGSQTYSVELYVKDTPANVSDYFGAELPKHGWTNAFTSNSNGDYVLSFSNESEDGTTQEGVTVSATAAEVEGYTTVSLLVTSSGG